MVSNSEYLRKALFGPFRLPIDFYRKFVHHGPDNSLVAILSRGIPLDYQQILEIYHWLDQLDPLFPDGGVEKILTGNALDECSIHEALKATRTAISGVGYDGGPRVVSKIALAWEQHYPGFTQALRHRLYTPGGHGIYADV